jgi:hypothetical protein
MEKFELGTTLSMSLWEYCVRNTRTIDEANALFIKVVAILVPPNKREDF